MSRWYRRYVGTVSDPKIAEAAVVADCSRSVVIATWDMILESAAESNDAGRFKATSRNVAATICEKHETVERVFSALLSLGMIEGDTVCAWSKRQFQSDSSTERSRKHRASKKPNGHATEMQRCATPPDTETDTDSETEGRNTARPESVAPRETDGRTAAYGDLKRSFNGTTETMLEFIENAMGGHCRPNAEQWLASTSSAHGSSFVAQAFAIMVEKQAAGEIIPRPLPRWSNIAAGLKARPQHQPQSAAAPGKPTVSELLRRKREAEVAA